MYKIRSIPVFLLVGLDLSRLGHALLQIPNGRRAWIGSGAAAMAGSLLAPPQTHALSDEELREKFSRNRDANSESRVRSDDVASILPRIGASSG